MNKYLQRQEAFLKEIIRGALIPADIIREAIDYSLFPGGKRIRPLFVYLIGELLEVPLQILDVIAAAIELTHCYSLIHDDLPAMDNDDLRRGKPSCHKAFDEATAILAGDGMQALAIEVLLTHFAPLLHSSEIMAITLELVKASGVSGMVSGQSLDLSELTNPSLHEETLTEIHQLKTGRLISACAEMVLLASAAPQASQSALRTYAQHIGLVFQMQDDYLDYYANSELLGKGRSSDVANQKITFARLYSKEGLEEVIGVHYQRAIEALNLFGDKACALMELTKKLQERTDIG